MPRPPPSRPGRCRDEAGPGEPARPRSDALLPSAVPAAPPRTPSTPHAGSTSPPGHLATWPPGHKHADAQPRSQRPKDLRRRPLGLHGPGGGRPWCLPLANRALLVAVSYRTDLTMRQLAPLFGISPATVCRVIHRLRPLLALEPALRPVADVDRLWIVDGTLVPHLRSERRDPGRLTGADTRGYVLHQRRDRAVGQTSLPEQGAHPAGRRPGCATSRSRPRRRDRRQGRSGPGHGPAARRGRTEP